MKKEYANPILMGFYPDPSICRVDENYYLACSSFAYFPGIPLFHSKDLVNWNLLTHVLDRREQLDLEGFGVSKGIFAPSIRYHKNIFYLTCTLVDGKNNFIVTANDPAGPWSDPVWIPEINGIDPSLFFDDDERCFLIYNSVGPDNKDLYRGHRTIRIREFDYENLKINGEEKILVNGGTDLSKQPIWIEGPHIFKRNDFYFLIAAEGGTGYDHSVVAFRSRSVFGPYEAFEENPVLTQRNVSTGKDPMVSSTGHADLVELPDGSWQAVFLGCRPYKGDHYNTGRETFLVPIEWKNDWPLLNPGNDLVNIHYPLPFDHPSSSQENFLQGNFSYKDDFDRQQLDANWIFLRTPKDQWLNIIQSRLSMKLRKETVSGKSNPSFLGRRQQHLHCQASIAMEFQPASANEKAGLIIFHNEDHYYFLCQSANQGKPVIELFRPVLNPRDGVQMQLLQSTDFNSSSNQPLLLKIVANGADYSFYYAQHAEDWICLEKNLDGKFLSTHTAGGFVGCVFGLYATSLGKESHSIASFDWFEYVGNDPVYIS